MSDKWKKKKKKWKKKENSRRKGRNKNICRGRKRKKEGIITDGAVTMGATPMAQGVPLQWLLDMDDRRISREWGYHEVGGKKRKTTSSHFITKIMHIMSLNMLCLEESSCHHLSPLSAWILASLKVGRLGVVDLQCNATGSTWHHLRSVGPGPD